MLLRYVPYNKKNQQSVLQRKRTEYQRFIDQHKSDPEDEALKKIHKVIYFDVLRTQPDMPMIHSAPIQTLLQRLLRIWHVRHPSSGYVQGINDITAAILVVFIQELAPSLDLSQMGKNYDLSFISDQEWLALEADTYWCLCAVLNQILDNYTQSQPGIIQGLSMIKALTQQLDPDLYNHLTKLDIDFYQFAFRWLFCLLLREYPLRLGIRLFDTYISDDDGFSVLHPYVCVATLLRWGSTLKTMEFNEIIIFLQSLPTSDWSAEELSLLIQQAYVYKQHYQHSALLHK